jgi:N-acetylglucosaminyl-diphospho-decaprenol L-rhamnosyltransferase
VASPTVVSEPAIGVAVVSYNTAPLLRRCLASVLADASGPVLVIDNCSTDGSADLVRREFPGVRLRAEQENRGYGAAANQAIEDLGTRYALLLNADTQVMPGALTALAAYLDDHPRVALAGPRLVTAAGRYEPSAHQFPGALALLLQESGLRRRLGLARRGEWRARPVDWILGAALALRREAFQGVGGFDEGYFLYQEEVDLCFRMLAAGWETHYAPVATVLHVGGASTSQRHAETFGHFVRSTRRFAHLRLSRVNAIGVHGVLAAVLMARLARDGARLGWVRDAERRKGLRRQTAAWLRGLAVLREPA